MVSLQTFGNSAVKFTFLNNALYLNNGEITVPLNSLMLVIDDSQLATFKKLNGDPFVSVSYSDLGMSKSELETWYKNNMVGGGEESGLTPSDVQDMIDTSISGYDEDIQDEIGEKEQVIAIALTELKNDKADASALTPYFDDAEYVSSAHTIYFYNNGVVKDSIDASDFIVDGMIDDVRIETISGASYLVIDFNTASGKEDIMIPISDIFDASNYYTKAETDSAITASVSGKADTTAVTADIAAAVSGKQDTLIAGKGIDITDDTLSIYFGATKTGGEHSLLLNFNANGETIDYLDIPLYGGIVSDSYDGRLTTKMQSSTYKWMSADTTSDSCNSSKFNVPSSAITFDMSRNPTTLLRWCAGGECDALIDSNGDNADPNSFDVVIDNGHVTVTAIGQILIEAIADDDCELDQYISNLQYWGCETDTIPNVVNTLLATKLDASAFNTYSAATDARLGEDEEVTAAALNALQDELGNKQDVLVAGDNITISGNVISADGGGKAIEGGRGITVTTSETADTVSFNLPISAGTSNGVRIGSGNASSNGLVHGIGSTASGTYSNVFAFNSTGNGNYSITAGGYLQNPKEFGAAFGQYNSYSPYNPIFSVGNGTSNSARHNAFQILDNGDIYITSGGTDIKLQDNLGGGSITIDPTLDSGSTNAVANSAITTAIDGINTRLGEDEEVTAAALNNLNDKFGGLKLVQISQSDYDALTVKDNSTLYIIV